MQVGHARTESVVAWWQNVKGVGESLRERYQAPEELPPKMLQLVRTLDAIEGGQVLRRLGTRPDYKRWLEDRTVAGIKAFPDWFVLT